MELAEPALGGFPSLFVLDGQHEESKRYKEHGSGFFESSVSSWPGNVYPGVLVRLSSPLSPLIGSTRLITSKVHPLEVVSSIRSEAGSVFVIISFSFMCAFYEYMRNAL